MARWKRERLFIALGALIVVNLIIVFVILPTPDTPLVRFGNRCSNTTNILPTKVQPSSRPKTLVIFVYSESSALKADNLKFFIEYGLCEHCVNVDYAFIMNGVSSVQIPQHKNIVVMERPNECGDFGAWGEFFQQLGPTYKKYKRIMFINDTVRGPFINPHFLLFSEQDFHFTDIFASYLSDETRMVGSYINCGGLIVGEGFAHVQSMSFMVDDVALELILPLFQCYDNRTETVKNGEIGMSKLLISKNINIASLLYAYRGVDFRCNDELRHNCNEQRDPAFDEWYFGFSANPMEVVFFKNNRKNSVLEQIGYQKWIMKTKDFT